MSTTLKMDTRRIRVQHQRTAGFILLVAMAFCWYGILYPASTVVKEWKAEFFPDAWKWVYVGTAYWVFVVFGLFTGKVWGWYVASMSLFLATVFAFQLAYPFIPSATNVMFMFAIGFFVLRSAPQVVKSDQRLNESADAIADSLGIRWEEQPLWILVQAGKTSEVLKYFEDHHPATANDYEFMDELSENVMALKLFILRETLHARKLPNP
jgi:hypothetical protein